MQARVALVGDFDSRVIAHQAIPLAIERAKRSLQVDSLRYEWKHTASLSSLESYDGVWCVPASPYADEGAALESIPRAREGRVPFLGTCGGFQHAVLEFARKVLGIESAEHEETATGAGPLVISRLSCSLVEVEEDVFATEGSRFAQIYGGGPIWAGYHCNFGFNANLVEAFETAGMKVAATDGQGEVRAMELADHPFFVGTLFQPERSALRDQPSPLIEAFIRAVTERGR